MRIAICDDMPECRVQVREHLNRYTATECFSSVTEFASADDLLAAYEQGNRFDLIFLDVEMAQTNGIDAGMRIKELDKQAILIFVSAHPQYAVFSYDCDALYYIVKPIDGDKFDRVLGKAMEKYKLLHQEYVLKNRSEIQRLAISDILYVEICRKHLLFHTVSGTYETVGKLSEALDELRPYGFCQVHQGYVVNMNHIKSFAQNDVVLSNGARVMVSVRKKTEVLRQYANFLERT